MTANETAVVWVKMTFTNDRGELPTDDGLRQLIADQMSGPLDDLPGEGGTGLACMAVEVLGRNGDLEGVPYVLVKGNPFDGMELIGPFTNVEDALADAEETCDGEDWWTVALIAPEDQ